MRKLIPGLLIVSFLLFSAFTIDALISWNINEDYNIKFSGRGAHGTFQGLSGTIIFDPEDLSASLFEVSVDATTIETGNQTKNKHARGSKWFHTEEFPVITFRSSQFQSTAEGYLVNGELELHGVRKSIAIPFTFEEEAGAGGVFSGQFTINRKDYSINGNAFGFAVAKELEVELRVPVSKKP